MNILDCTYNGICGPAQIIFLTYAIDNLSDLHILQNEKCEYDRKLLEYAYSIDGACWTCFMDYDTALQTTVALNQDFFIKIKVKGPIAGVKIQNDNVLEYSTSLMECFNFSYLDASANGNLYNPYSNLTNALQLQQYLNESVSSITGIPIYYFKLAPNVGSKDITFKEYTLMDVESVKQIKLIIQDGIMPSSKNEFADYGFNWQTDWETEITKMSFATAFGPTAQPMEGDLIYIPMMKRMWMVAEAYDEKNGGLMWQSTTFKVYLTKYQEKGSVDLGDTEQLVNSFVKNKYDDLFGEDEDQTLNSGTDSVDAPKYTANNLYPVYESDATRKYISVDGMAITRNDTLYYSGTTIADSRYQFLTPSMGLKVVYQKEYCGDSGTASFIFCPALTNIEYESNIIKIGNISLKLNQYKSKCTLYFPSIENMSINLVPNSTYFVIFSWDKNLNICSLSVYKYVYNENVPKYKLNPVHYKFDIDNPVKIITSKYDIELTQSKKGKIEINGFYGWITNIKLFDVYNENISECLQMYPTHQHLLVNDTARNVLAGQGVKPN